MTDAVQHTDDQEKPENLTAEQYDAEVQRLADEAGDEGLHTIPAEYLPDNAFALPDAGGDESYGDPAPPAEDHRLPDPNEPLL